MNFTNEQIEKAKNCKTLEEFKALAKAEGLDVSEEEAEKYFNATRMGELTDEDVDAVAGGGKWKPQWEEYYDEHCPFCSVRLKIKITKYTKGEDWKYECTPNMCSCGAKIKTCFGTQKFQFTKNGENRFV